MTTAAAAACFRTIIFPLRLPTCSANNGGVSSLTSWAAAGDRLDPGRFPFRLLNKFVVVMSRACHQRTSVALNDLEIEMEVDVTTKKALPVILMAERKTIVQLLKL